MCPKLSIIIPVYNLEKYIARCLDSIVNQLPDDGSVQVYVIDDGSTDQSANIIKKYKQINYVYKENGGVSSARNLGLTLINSEYVTFVDGDDWVSNDYLSVILGKLKDNPDLLCFNALEVHKDYVCNILKISQKCLFLKPHEGINGFLTGDLYRKVEGYVWNKVFKINIIKDNDLKFDETQRVCEDLLFNSFYVDHIKSIHFVDRSLYNYYINSNSAIHGYKSWRSNEYVKFIEKFLKYGQQNGYQIDTSKLLSFYISWWFSVIFDESFGDDFKRGYDKVKKYLNHPYFINNMKEINMKDLSFKRKVYFVLIQMHMSKLLYRILFYKNKSRE